MKEDKAVMEVITPMPTAQDQSNASNQIKDPRELAYSQIVQYLFDYTKLLFISRLNDDLSASIIKNKVVIYFYHDYYSECQVTIKLIPCDEPPYYKKKIIYKIFATALKKKLLAKYPQLLNDVMAITVSHKGLGREEALNILRNTKEELDQKNVITRLMQQ